MGISNISTYETRGNPAPVIMLAGIGDQRAFPLVSLNMMAAPSIGLLVIDQNGNTYTILGLWSKMGQLLREN